MVARNRRKKRHSYNDHSAIRKDEDGLSFKSLSKVAEEEDICPVCDSECRCTNRGDMSKSHAKVSESTTSRKSNMRLGKSETYGDTVEGSTSSKSLAGLRRIYRTITDTGSDHHEEENDRGEQTKYYRGKSLRRIRTSPAINEAQMASDSETLASDDSDVLEFEERRIQEEGINSEEEENEVVSSDDDGAKHGADFIPVIDPNEVDHIWSTEEEHSHTEDSDVLDSTKLDYPETDGKKNNTENLQKKAKVKKPCKRRLSTVSAGSGIEESASENIRASSLLSPEMIQTYLASRGIHISPERAVHFAETVNRGSLYSTNSSAVETKSKTGKSSSSKSETQADGKVLTSRFSALDPRMLSKEAKQMEALQAQAIGGLNAHSKGETGSTKVNGAAIKKHVDLAQKEIDIPCIPLEELLELESSDSDSQGETNHLASKASLKWDKIPIGTFRRTRKVSAPLLKLSKAVKNTFGVVPPAIYETLLGSGTENLPVVPETFIYLPSARGSSKRNSSVHVGPPTHELGMGSFIGKKLSNKKNEIMENVRKREKELKDLLSLSTNIGNKDEVEDDSYCSCSECESFERSKKARRSGKHYRSRRSSMPFNDLSLLIHDPANPPSACASPNNLFLHSPELFGNIEAADEIEEFELEPPAIESDVKYQKRKRKSSLFNIGKMTVANIEPFLKYI